MDKWYQKSGPDSDIVVSTRIRFARNLMNCPFPCKLESAQRKKISFLVKDALLNGNSAIASRFSYIDMERINDTQAISLVEKYLVSPDFISDRKGKGLLLIDDESVSIMINEEDHIRLQIMQQGLNLEQAYELGDKIDSLLDEKLSFAFDDRLGYLTQCPTNLGTGMRASLMLHLAALQENGAVPRVSENLSKLGLTLRGSHGEGTESKGALYQLSNQVTLGLSEREAISNLKDISLQLIEQERSLRYSMARHMETLDTINRSLGILLNAKLLSNDEFMNLISNIRLGVSIKEIEGISYDKINTLIIDSQPATLIKNAGKNLDARERDKARAELVKKVLKIK